MPSEQPHHLHRGQPVLLLADAVLEAHRAGDQCYITYRERPIRVLFRIRAVHRKACLPLRSRTKCRTCAGPWSAFGHSTAAIGNSPLTSTSRPDGLVSPLLSPFPPRVPSPGVAASLQLSFRPFHGHAMCASHLSKPMKWPISLLLSVSWQRHHAPRTTS